MINFTYFMYKLHNEYINVQVTFIHESLIIKIVASRSHKQWHCILK